MTAEDVRFIWGWWSSTGNMHLCKNRFREELYSQKFKKKYVENQVGLVKDVVYQIVGKGEVVIKDMGRIFTIQGPVRGVYLGFKKESYFEDEMMYGKIDYQELLSAKDNLNQNNE